MFDWRINNGDIACSGDTAVLSKTIDMIYIITEFAPMA